MNLRLVRSVVVLVTRLQERDTASTGNRPSQQPITLPSTIPSEGSNINQPKLTAQSPNVIKNYNLPLTYTPPHAPERKFPLGTRIHPRYHPLLKGTSIISLWC
jgi:hypothetical protein